MASYRFINCDIWQDAWFDSLPMQDKLVFIYMFTRCDPAGVWEINASRLQVDLKLDKFSLTEFLKQANGVHTLLAGNDAQAVERIRIMKDGRHLWLVKFVEFQNPGGLNWPPVRVGRAATSDKGPNTAHKPVVLGLIAHGLLDEVKAQYARREGDLAAIHVPVSELRAEAAFNEFWKLYPRRVGKEAARRQFVKIAGKSPAQLLEACKKALAWQIKQPDWLKESGQFIPYPAKYLYQHQFADESTDKTDRSTRYKDGKF